MLLFLHSYWKNSPQKQGACVRIGDSVQHGHGREVAGTASLFAASLPWGRKESQMNLLGLKQGGEGECFC